MNFFDWLAETSIGEASLASIFSVVILFIVCVIVIRIIGGTVGRALDRGRLDGTLKRFIVKAIKAVLWVLTIIIVSGRLGIPSASLIAALGVVGLAFSLSVQDLLTNLFAGFTILTTKPFVAGEIIELGDISGTVQSVDLFRTAVKTRDNKVAFVPNSDIAKAKIINCSREELRRVDMDFSVSGESDPDRVRATLMRIISRDTRIFVDPAPEVVTKSFDKGTIKLCLRVWVRSAGYWPVYHDLTEAVLDGFRLDGIQLA